MSAHTPGPWIVSSDGKAARSSADIMGNYRRNVVSVGKRDNAEDMAANLRLCAAAPELLEALEMVAEYVAEGYLSEEQEQQIANALKKARGN